MPSDRSEEDKKEMETAALVLKNMSIGESSEKVSMMDEGQHDIEVFVNKLLDSFYMMKHKHSTFASLKAISESSLFRVLAQESYHELVFNYSLAGFSMDMPALTLHNAFVIVFARKITIENICEINFKIHYKNRRPQKVNLILVAEEF